MVSWMKTLIRNPELGSNVDIQHENRDQRKANTALQAKSWYSGPNSAKRADRRNILSYLITPDLLSHL